MASVACRDLFRCRISGAMLRATGAHFIVAVTGRFLFAGQNDYFSCVEV